MSADALAAKAAPGAVAAVASAGGFLGQHAAKSWQEWCAIIGIVAVATAMGALANLAMLESGRRTADQMRAARRLLVGAYGMLAMGAFAIVLIAEMQLGSAILVSLAFGVAGPFVVARYLKRMVFREDGE